MSEFNKEPQTEEEKKLMETNPEQYAKNKGEELKKYISKLFDEAQKQDSQNEENLDGEVIEYDGSGNLQERKFYIKGKLNGEYRKYEKGELIERKNYKNDLLDGYYETYQASKLLLKTEYKEGEPHGISYFYFPNGLVQGMCWFNMGKKEGAFLLFSELGTLSKREIYVKNELNGESLSYFENQTIAQKGNYENGLKDGQWITYLPDGSIYQIEHYAAGTLIGKKIIDSKI